MNKMQILGLSLIFLLCWMPHGFFDGAAVDGKCGASAFLV